MNILIINGHDYARWVADGGYDWSRDDLDSEKTKRVKNGTMRRDKITEKRNLSFTMLPMPEELAAQLDSDLHAKQFSVSYHDLHGDQTREFYVMACKPVCKLCDRLVISQTVAFIGGNLVINLPAGSYRNHEKYCIVVAQAIPDATTINAPVFVTIGAGTQLYPLTDRCCAQLTACAIRARTRYSAVVSTSGTGGTFKLLGSACPCPTNNLPSINGTAPAAPAAPGA